MQKAKLTAKDLKETLRNNHQKCGAFAPHNQKRSVKNETEIQKCRNKYQQ